MTDYKMNSCFVDIAKEQLYQSTMLHNFPFLLVPPAFDLGLEKFAFEKHFSDNDL